MDILNKVDYIAKEDVIDFMKKMPDSCIDLIVTDPPYLINYKSNHRKQKHRFSEVIQNNDNPGLIKQYIKECYRILKE